MYNAEILMAELENETPVTRKMLARVPNDKFDWKPHPKSMTIRQLATHIAELPGWVTMAVTTPGLDFAANPYQQEHLDSSTGLLDLFDRSLSEAKNQLQSASEDKLNERWVLRNGDDIYSDTTKGEVVRMSLNQIIHHRAQLGLYLRLLDVAIPGTYGPSADESF